MICTDAMKGLIQHGEERFQSLSIRVGQIEDAILAMSNATRELRTLIVNGSWRDMVELRLEPPLVSRSLLIPIRCSCVRVSLEAPDDFLAALGAVGTRPNR